MSDVHRDHPEASAQEIEMIQLGQLMRAPSSEPTQERDCRDCGTTFLIAVRLAAKPRTKWTSLCPSCASLEI